MKTRISCDLCPQVWVSDYAVEQVMPTLWVSPLTVAVQHLREKHSEIRPEQYTHDQLRRRFLLIQEYESYEQIQPYFCPSCPDGRQWMHLTDSGVKTHKLMHEVDQGAKNLFREESGEP